MLLCAASVSFYISIIMNRVASVCMTTSVCSTIAHSRARTQRTRPWRTSRSSLSSHRVARPAASQRTERPLIIDVAVLGVRLELSSANLVLAADHWNANKSCCLLGHTAESATHARPERRSGIAIDSLVFHTPPPPPAQSWKGSPRTVVFKSWLLVQALGFHVCFVSGLLDPQRLAQLRVAHAAPRGTSVVVLVGLPTIASATVAPSLRAKVGPAVVRAVVQDIGGMARRATRPLAEAIGRR